MDWFNQHIEIIAYVMGAVLTFTIWNINQGNRTKNLETDLAEHKEQVTKELTRHDSEVRAVRVRQDSVEKGLMDELRRIGEELAHIKGFMSAQKQSARKS